MNSVIVSFLVFGALLGLAIYPVRHLFSKGTVSYSENGERGPMDGRTMWVAICVFLWPILMFTGLCTMIYKRARAQRQRSVRHG